MYKPKFFTPYQVQGRWSYIFIRKDPDNSAYLNGFEIGEYGIKIFQNSGSVRVDWFKEKEMAGYVSEFSFDEIREKDKKNIISSIFEYWGD